MLAWAFRRRVDRVSAIVCSSVLVLMVASGCNRSDRDPSPVPSASPAVTTPPPAAPTETVPAPKQPEIDGAQPTKPEGTIATGCSTDSDCRAFSDSCTICSCRPLGKSAPDPKCNGKRTTCLIDPCTGLRALCRKGTCVVGDQGDAASASDAANPSDATTKDAAPAKDVTSDSAAVKATDAASSTKTDAAAAPSSSAPTKGADAAAN